MRVVGIALAVAIGATVPGVYVGWDVEPLGSLVASSLSGAPLVEEYAWSTQSSLASFAFEVRAFVPAATDCVLTFAAAGRTVGVGPVYVKVVETGEGRVWSSLSHDGAAQAHVEGVVDTRVVSTREGDRWALQSLHRRPLVEGHVSWFFAASHLEPWVGHEWSGADAVRFQFSCDEGFRVEQVLVDPGVRMLSEASLGRGQTVHVSLAGTLVRESALRADLTSAGARLMLGQNGNEGSLRLYLPKGPRELALASSPSYEVAAQGPGEYGVGLDCLCRGTLWAVLADLRPVPGLDAVSGATG